MRLPAGKRTGENASFDMSRHKLHNRVGMKADRVIP